MSVAALCTCCEDVCTIGVVNPFVDLDLFTTVGSPSVDAGELVIAFGDEVYFSAVPASVDDPIKLTIHARTEDETAALDLLVAVTNDDNMAGGRVIRDSGAITVQPFKVDGGTLTMLGSPETVVDTGAELDAAHEISICYTRGTTIDSYSAEIGLITCGQVVAIGDWQDVEEALVEDDVGARYDFGTDESAPAISWTDWNLVDLIPPGSTIDGISCGVRCVEIALTGLGNVKITSMQLVGPTGLVGDDLADGSVYVPNVIPGYQYIGHGGATEKWGLAPIPLSLLEAVSFGFSVVFTSEGSVSIDVDNPSLSIWFTTPERVRGKLTIAYRNSSDSSITCSTSYNVELMTPGVSTGLRGFGGEFRVGDYKLEYAQSATRPTCPVCGPCSSGGEGTPCDCCPEPAEQYLVTIADPWNNSNCDNCEGFGGTYVLDPNGDTDCWWTFTELVDGCEDACAPDGVRSHTVHLRIVGSGEACRWQASLHTQGFALNPFPCGASMVYLSAEFAEGDCHVGMPLTLTFVSDTEGAASMCTPDPPGTLEIDIA
jgi:hypothetical protein